MTSLSRPWQLLLLLCLHIPGRSCGSLLSQPIVQWTKSLSGSNGYLSDRGLRKGNAVVAQKDGKLLFITAEDGSLHILDTGSLRDGGSSGNNGNAVFEPEPEVGTYTECRSSVTQVENEDGLIEYLIYAVIDTPIVSGVDFDGIGELDADTSVNGSANSRVLAVNLDGSLRWTLYLNGIIAGTPLVGHGGKTIYVSHNVKDGTNDPFDSRRGYLSIILVRDEVAEVTATFTEDAPFGPPSLVSTTQAGGGRDGFMTDIVTFAESWDYGYRADGSLYMLLPSDRYEDWEGESEESYTLRLVSSWPYGSMTRPTMTSDGNFLWMTGWSSTVSGWADNRGVSRIISGRDEDIFPSWTATYQSSERNETQPIYSSAVVSSEMDLLYFGGASYDLFCVEADSGKEVWTDLQGRSIYMVEPKLSEIDGSNVVYAIESLNGNVRQHDAYSGTRNWEFNCFDLTGIPTCNDAVEAEFSLAPSGNVLYYGDIYGTIVALEVAEYATDAPTNLPTGRPSQIPSQAPSLSYSPTYLPSQSPSGQPTTEADVGSDIEDGSDPGGGSEVDAGSGVPEEATAQTQTPSVASESDTVNNAETATSGNGDENSTDLLPMIIGASVAVVVVTVLAFFLLIRRVRNKKNETVVLETLSSRELKFDASGDDSSVSVEVIGGAPVYSPKNNRKKKKKAPSTPQTPQTLDCIEEDREEGTPTEPSPATTAVMLIGDETYQRQDHHSNEEFLRERTTPVSNRSGESPAKCLDEAFSYVVEVQTDGEEEASVHTIELPEGRTYEELDSFLEAEATNRETGDAAEDLENEADIAQHDVPMGEEFHKDPESSTSPSYHHDPDAENTSTYGLVGTSNGGSHLELSVGNNTNFRPISSDSLPTRMEDSQQDLNASSSHSRMSTDSQEEIAKALEEEKKESDRENNETEVHSPKPIRQSMSASQHLSPAMSSTSSLYLDENSEIGQSAFQPPDSPMTAEILGFLDKAITQVSDDQPPGYLLQPSLGRDIQGHANLNDDHEFSLMAPGSHYMTDRKPIGQTSWTAPAQAQTGPKTGASVRPKGGKFPRFRATKSKGGLSGYQEFDGSDSDTSQELRNEVKAKPTFRIKGRNSKLEKEQKREGTEQKREDSWADFLMELEEAEKQFFKPTNNAPPNLLDNSSNADSARPASAAPSPPPPKHFVA